MIPAIPIEKQVVSLEMAKELDKRGIKFDSVWWWARYKNEDYAIVLMSERGKLNVVYTEWIPAPTVAEMGLLLPSYVKNDNGGIERIKTERNGGHYICYFRRIKVKGNATVTSIVEFSRQTEANARAKMLCWLKDNGYLEEDI